MDHTSDHLATGLKPNYGDACAAFRAFEVERTAELEAYLALRLPVPTSPAVIKDCIDWNSHLIKTRPDAAGYVPPAYSKITTFTEDGFDAHIRQVFHDAVTCRMNAVDRSLLSLWIRHCFRKAWQHTYRFNRLRLTQTAFMSAAKAAWTDGSLQDRDHRLLELVLEYLDLLAVEIQAEDQLHTGSLPLQRAAVLKVIPKCRQITTAARSLVNPDQRDARRDPDPDAEDVAAQIASHIATQTASRERYNHALLASNQGVRAATEGRWSEVNTAIRTIEAAARDTPEDAFTELSEIGALQQSLERFKEHRRVPWLRIDRGRIAYLYPFGVTGLTYEGMVEKLRAGVRARQGDTDRPNRLWPSELSEHFTAHSDIWHPHARQDQRFDGVELRYPEVSLTVGDTTETLQVAIRFTSLGMHCLRLERPVRDLLPHDLNAVLLRGLREHGTVTVTCADADLTWKRLSRLARTLLNVDLLQQLQGGDPEAKRGGAAKGASSTGPDAGRPESRTEAPEAATRATAGRDARRVPAVPAERATIHRGRPHVLLRIQHASEYRPGRRTGTRPVRDGERLLDLFGASGLLNAAPATKESIGDWARLSGRRHKVILGLRNEGDVLISTENSTIIASLDTPSNLSAELEALADFTVCIGGALGAWNQTLDDFQAMNARLSNGYDKLKREKRKALGLLQSQRAALTRFENETRRVLAVLYSPNLLRSSVHAAVLLRLFENSGIDRQVQSFRVRLAEVVADQTEVNLQRWEADRKQQTREATAIALSALGICAAFQIWQAAGVWNDRAWTVLTFLVVVGSAGFMLRRRLAATWAWFAKASKKKNR